MDESPLAAMESSLADAESLLATQPESALAILQPLLRNLLLLQDSELQEEEEAYDPSLGRPRRQKEHTVKHDAEKSQVHKATAVSLYLLPCGRLRLDHETYRAARDPSPCRKRLIPG